MRAALASPWQRVKNDRMRDLMRLTFQEHSVFEHQRVSVPIRYLKQNKTVDFLRPTKPSPVLFEGELCPSKSQSDVLGEGAAQQPHVIAHPALDDHLKQLDINT